MNIATKQDLDQLLSGWLRPVPPYRCGHRRPRHDVIGLTLPTEPETRNVLALITGPDIDTDARRTAQMDLAALMLYDLGLDFQVSQRTNTARCVRS